MSHIVCCFCTNPVSEESPVQITAPIEEGSIQSLWAHGACLGERLHPSVPTLLPRGPHFESLVFLAVTSAGLEQALHLSAGAPVWCGADAIGETEFEKLKGRNVTRFTYSLKLNDSSALADAVATIQEHHPGASLWVEGANGL